MGSRTRGRVQSVTSRGIRSLWSPRPLFTIGTSSFTWPVDPQNSATGFKGGCPDGTCYWIASETRPDASKRWRDAQPFLQSYSSSERGYHLGADYNLGSGNADENKLVYAVADGRVTYSTVRTDRARGTVAIEHLTPEGPITSFYLHLAPSGLPANGALVSKGAVIGKISPSISGMPPHLHFEIRRGRSTLVDKGYVATQATPTPNGQIDPNDFIARRRN